MKNLILLFIMISWTNLFSQGYKSLKKNISFNPEKDNVVYSLDNNFIYDYNVSGPSAKGKIILNKNGKDWQIGDNDTPGILIDKIKMIIVKRNLFKRINFFQTQINYEFITKPELPIIEETSLIENKQNLWIHPPRSNFFKILELAPFPYIKFPLKEGSNWTDEIAIGDHWSNPHWGEWQGKLKLKISYIVHKGNYIEYGIDSLNVYKIHATSISELGKSTLDAYFTKKEGIIKLEYNILGKFKINFNLLNK